MCILQDTVLAYASHRYTPRDMASTDDSYRYTLRDMASGLGLVLLDDDRKCILRDKFFPLPEATIWR